nr:MAG TPA: hypothetical protein [Caudoviricetes sp.]
MILSVITEFFSKRFLCFILSKISSTSFRFRIFLI